MVLLKNGRSAVVVVVLWLLLLLAIWLLGTGHLPFGWLPLLVFWRILFSLLSARSQNAMRPFE